MVGARAADHLAGAAARAVGGLAHDFGAAVAVEVVDHELRVVRAGADVAAEIDAPQPRAVELVGIEVHVARVARLRVVLRVGRIPLEHVFELAVAVEVADGHVVGGVGVTSRPTAWCRPRESAAESRYCCVGAFAGSVKVALAACSMPPTTGRTKYAFDCVRRRGRVDEVGGGGHRRAVEQRRRAAVGSSGTG